MAKGFDLRRRAVAAGQAAGGDPGQPGGGGAAQAWLTEPVTELLESIMAPDPPPAVVFIELVLLYEPATVANCRSRGVAIDDAIVSGLAPGSCALTVMVEMSTCGNGATRSFE